MSDCIHIEVCGKCYAEPKECGCYEQRREKCRNIGYGLRFECSACHQTVGGETPNFCPKCGREVEQ